MFKFFFISEVKNLVKKKKKINEKFKYVNLLRVFIRYLESIGDNGENMLF